MCNCFPGSAGGLDKARQALDLHPRQENNFKALVQASSGIPSQIREKMLCFWETCYWTKAFSQNSRIVLVGKDI